jgi:hypothetical protein
VGGGAAWGSHGMGAAALGRSDSGRRRTSRGVRWARCEQGRTVGRDDVSATADKWGATTRGPGGSGWVRE